MADFNQQIIDEFRANDGKVGGMFEGASMLILHTTGARTGKERVNPLAYRREGERMFVFASAAGAPENPDWYHNLVANPDVTVEVGVERVAATASVLERAERDRVYAAQAAVNPQFAEYQANISRVIPVVAIDRKS